MEYGVSEEGRCLVDNGIVNDNGGYCRVERAVGGRV